MTKEERFEQWIYGLTSVTFDEFLHDRIGSHLLNFCLMNHDNSPYDRNAYLSGES